MLLRVGACLLLKYIYLILTYYEGIPCTEFEIYRESQGVKVKELVTFRRSKVKDSPGGHIAAADLGRLQH